MNAKKVKHTAGKFRVVEYSSGMLSVHTDTGVSICAVGCNLTDGRDDTGNANFIAEAFNVHHETGLTPRQLAEQRAELLEALRELTPSMPPENAPCHAGLVAQHKCAHCQRIARARAALAKAEGSAP